MLKRLIALGIICALTFILTHNVAARGNYWDEDHTYIVTSETVPVFIGPDADSGSKFLLYKGMEFKPGDVIDTENYKWFKIGDKSYWVPAIAPNGVVNLTMNSESEKQKIIDLYGIMDMPHRYAVKMVKYPGAKGRIETYKKIGDEYVMQHTYTTVYRKEGPKTKYGDLKSPGGNVIRYLYRTTNSSMNGWDKSGQKFGVYKVSYPMPHDALPHLLAGRISTYQYNKIPAINYIGDKLYPHPGSYMGADIVLHTAKKGSRGCITVENEAMSMMYHEDLVTENDKEIIPFIIYDEDVEAPPIGELF